MKLYDLAKEIEKSGLSINQVADYSGFSRTNLSNLLKGKADFKYNSYEMLLNSIGITDITPNDEIMELIEEILKNTCYTINEWADMTGIPVTVLNNIAYRGAQSINFKYIKNVAKMFAIYNDLDLKYCISLDEMIIKFYESARNVSQDLEEISRYTGVPLRTIVDNVATHWATGTYKKPSTKTAQKMRRFL